MKVYLVGGAVRDELLGLPVTEKDWVVVGETDESMKKMGFKSVGKDFPVYLHPTSKEEYALARKERKVSPGHKGFSFETQKNVTLEEDLYRRDITINAIAQDVDGNLIDPFNGKQDIKEKRIKHVSDAFIEDPLRVFRVARFATKLKSLNFSVEDQTKELMISISDSKEIEELSFERIWQETEKSLGYKNSSHYFNILKEVNALSPFPKMIDNFEASLERLKIIEQVSDKKELKWAALNFENKNLNELSMPNKFKNFLKCSQIFKETIDKEISAKNLLEGLMKINTFRNSNYALDVINFILKLNININFEINWNFLVEDLEKIKPQINKQDNGENIKEKVYKERLIVIENYLK
jgi:tRNA nucleotidyltransferase (CCA-adding enzyme)